MKPYITLLFVFAGIMLFSCKDDDDDKTDREKLLTAHVWVADSLLANGVDASGPGGVLEKFKGEAKFNTDGTGTFGEYSGTWTMSSNQDDITIVAEELLVPVLARIVELTETSLKITASVPDMTTTPTSLIAIRMTFKAK